MNLKCFILYMETKLHDVDKFGKVFYLCCFQSIVRKLFVFEEVDSLRTHFLNMLDVKFFLLLEFQQLAPVPDQLYTSFGLF